MCRFVFPSSDHDKRSPTAKLSLLLVLCSILVLLAVPAPAYACTCAQPATVGQALNQAEAVFAGTVVDVDTSTLPFLGTSSLPLRVTFEVSEVWKGALSRRVVVRTARDEAGCGFDFAAGRDYLVYARRGEDGLATGMCDRTSAISNAGADLAALGAGESPLAIGAGLPIWLRLALGSVFFLLGVGAVLAFAIVRGRLGKQKEPS